MYNIYPCSDRAKKLILTDKDIVGVDEINWNDVNGNTKYPWRFLHIGQSFAVPYLWKISEISLRRLASKKGKEYKKKFSVMKHNEFNVYEVVRIA